MQVLILGGTRFCGKQLGGLLMQAGHNVTVSSRKPQGAPQGAAIVGGERNEALKTLIGSRFDVVFDFTAHSEKDVELVLEAVTMSHYFLVSTIWLKKIEENRRVELSPLTKKYLEGKASAEKAAINANSKVRGTTVLRFPVLMGTGDHTKRLEFYLNRLRSDEGLVLVNGGLATLQPMFSDDIALATQKLLDIDLTKLPPLIEALPDNAITLKQFVSQLASLASLPLRVKNVPAKYLESVSPDFLANEPFYTELLLTSRAPSLFEIAGVKPRTIEEWLPGLIKKTHFEGVIRFDGEIQALTGQENYLEVFLEREEVFKKTVSLVQEVGNLVLSWRNDPKRHEIHDPKKFKTEADSQAHALLVQGLSCLTPGIPVISEEDVKHSTERAETYWLIDPIDGTASWYGGFNGFVTQVAFIKRGRPVFGVIFAPALGKTYLGHTGWGGWVNGKPLEPEERSLPVLVDNYPEPRGIAKSVVDHLRCDYLESGSLGLKAALVAEGKADIFIKDVTFRDWDLAPAIPILESVGGEVRLLNGLPLRLEGPFDKEEGFLISRDTILLNRILNFIGRNKNGTSSN